MQKINQIDKEGGVSPFTVWYSDALAIHKIYAVGVPNGFGNIVITRSWEGPHANNRNYDLFYSSLEDNIREKGFKNPILCWNKDKLYCVYGTSRLRIAKKLKVSIPTFIVDFTGNWEEGERIHNEEQALQKFTEIPESFVYTSESFNFYNEKWPLDPLVRKAKNLPQNKLVVGETVESIIN